MKISSRMRTKPVKSDATASSIFLHLYRHEMIAPAGYNPLGMSLKLLIVLLAGIRFI